MRTNGIEQISVLAACVTSANVDSWTVHRLSAEPMPGPICTNASVKANLERLVAGLKDGCVSKWRFSPS